MKNERNNYRIILTNTDNNKTMSFDVYCTPFSAKINTMDLRAAADRLVENNVFKAVIIDVWLTGEVLLEINECGEIVFDHLL